MQINGQSLLTAYSPNSVEQRREVIRPPVIIDAEPRASTSRPLLPSATEVAAYQTQLTQEQGREARFVRLLADDDTQAGSPSSTTVTVPVGIEQYRQIAALDANTVVAQQRLFDAIV